MRGYIVTFFVLLLTAACAQSSGGSRGRVETGTAFSVVAVIFVVLLLTAIFLGILLIQRTIGAHRRKRAEHELQIQRLENERANAALQQRTRELEIQALRSQMNLLRVHHSHLINVNEILKYIKGEGGYLVMSDGASINVSRSKKDRLLRLLQPNKF